MEKRKSKAAPVRKVSFYNNNSNGIQDFRLCDSDTEIRLGISIADEKAKQEHKIGRGKAPLSTEERIFLGKL